MSVIDVGLRLNGRVGVAAQRNAKSIGDIGVPGFDPVPGGSVVAAVAELVRSVLLRGHTARQIVGVDVADAVSEIPRPGVVGVPQVRRHRADQTSPYVVVR